MTDGAGFMNRACKSSRCPSTTLILDELFNDPRIIDMFLIYIGAQIIKRRLNLPSIPVAVQARIGGAKGMVRILGSLSLRI